MTKHTTRTLLVIPMKDPKDAKTRLGGSLDRRERSILALSLFEMLVNRIQRVLADRASQQDSVTSIDPCRGLGQPDPEGRSPTAQHTPYSRRPNRGPVGSASSCGQSSPCPWLPVPLHSTGRSRRPETCGPLAAHRSCSSGAKGRDLPIKRLGHQRASVATAKPDPLPVRREELSQSLSRHG